MENNRKEGKRGIERKKSELRNDGDGDGDRRNSVVVKKIRELMRKLERLKDGIVCVCNYI